MNNGFKKRIIKYRNLKEASIKNYSTSFKKLAEHLEVKYLSLKVVREKFETILEYISSLSKSLKVSRISALLILLSPKGKQQPAKKDKELYNKLNTMVIDINNAYNKEKIDQVKSKKERDNWVSWLQIVNKYEKIEKHVLNEIKLNEGVSTNKQLFDLQKLLIFALYIRLPPKRLDYCNIEVISEETFKKIKVLGNNIKSKKYLVIKSRTKKYFSFGCLTLKSEVKDEDFTIIDIPSNLNKIINMFLENNKSGVLLINSKGNALSKNGLSKIITGIFKKHFNKSVGVSLIRKAFWSHLNKDDVSLKMKMQIARMMNHSIQTATLHYTKQ